MTEPDTVRRFGPFAFDTRSLELFREGIRVPLQTQPAALLALLLDRAGDVVTRDEIRAHLWADTAVAFDQSINYCVRQIRIALGGDANLLETLPRRGYRFHRPEPVVAPRRTARVTDLLRRVVVPLAAGLLIGAAIGDGFVRPRQPVFETVEAAVDQIMMLAEWNVEHIRAHIAGETTCPYLQLLIPNSRGTHRSM